ncbi:MAG: energy transducer TonB [Williamsia sp.]|nr:energy transducer TonB [Williamsia sp.]
MITHVKTSRHQIFGKTLLTAGWLLLLAVTGSAHTIPTLSGVHVRNDTLPQTEIYHLKRADIYVVIVENDSVRVRLKNRDSIMMSRASFDTLSAAVKKEISARNDGIFTNIQIESAYPGGPSGWLAYLNRTFSYPQEAVRNGIQGTVIVQFIVDDQGKVSDIEVVSGPVSGGLREEAIRVIRKSGKWEPAIWNGYKVTSYKKQPLIFRLNP